MHENATSIAGTAGAKFQRLVEIMARLRAPGGCPWDREQTFESIKPYTLQETYEVLDAIMRMYMEEDRSLAEIIAAGYAVDDVKRVTRLIKINEYKRRQAPIGIRVTHRAFGRDWRYPITSRYTEPVE